LAETEFDQGYSFARLQLPAAAHPKNPSLEWVNGWLTYDAESRRANAKSMQRCGMWMVGIGIAIVILFGPNSGSRLNWVIVIPLLLIGAILQGVGVLRAQNPSRPYPYSGR